MPRRPTDTWAWRLTHLHRQRHHPVEAEALTSAYFNVHLPLGRCFIADRKNRAKSMDPDKGALISSHQYMLKHEGFTRGNLERS